MLDLNDVSSVLAHLSMCNLTPHAEKFEELKETLQKRLSELLDKS